MREAWRTTIMSVAVAGLLTATGAASAGAPDDDGMEAETRGVATDAEGRYALRVLYQPERDLNNADTRINVMVDTRTGRSWVLRHTRMPESNERGFVWVEIPFAPKALPGN